MNKLGAMRTFATIVDEGSLTAAGRALGKSLPTVVRTLADLERELGVVLLRRTTRRMSLSDEGRLYLDRVRQILADVDEAEAMLRTDDRPRGRIRLTAPVLFGRMHVAPVVNGFLHAHPGVQVELLLLDRVANLVEEGLDLAVRIGRLPDSSLVATRVGWMRRVICAAPTWIDVHGEPAEPEELASLRCVTFSGGGGFGADVAWPFVVDGRPISVRVRGPLATNQAAAAVEACTAGLGPSSFLHYQVAPAVEAGRLRILLEAYEPPPLPISLVYADARFVAPRLRSFVDAMAERLRREFA